jgi:hypothetical protein
VDPVCNIFSLLHVHCLLTDLTSDHIAKLYDLRRGELGTNRIVPLLVKTQFPISIC